MKSQKRSQGPPLRKTNNRWKWMSAATATAAGIAGTQANAITINLKIGFDI
jgi:hypothetical protein